MIWNRSTSPIRETHPQFPCYLCVPLRLPLRIFALKKIVFHTTENRYIYEMGVFFSVSNDGALYQIRFLNPRYHYAIFFSPAPFSLLKSFFR